MIIVSLHIIQTRGAPGSSVTRASDPRSTGSGFIMIAGHLVLESHPRRQHLSLSADPNFH